MSATDRFFLRLPLVQLNTVSTTAQRKILEILCERDHIVFCIV